MLEASFHNMPDPYDGLRPRPYVARYPHPTPSYFPQHPLRTLRDPALFASMDPDTLFFIFYYQQGTYEQSVFVPSLSLHQTKPREALSTRTTTTRVWEGSLFLHLLPPPSSPFSPSPRCFVLE